MRPPGFAICGFQLPHLGSIDRPKTRPRPRLGSQATRVTCHASTGVCAPHGPRAFDPRGYGCARLSRKAEQATTEFDAVFHCLHREARANRNSRRRVPIDAPLVNGIIIGRANERAGAPEAVVKLGGGECPSNPSAGKWAAGPTRRAPSYDRGAFVCFCSRAIDQSSMRRRQSCSLCFPLGSQKTPLKSVRPLIWLLAPPPLLCHTSLYVQSPPHPHPPTYQQQQQGEQALLPQSQPYLPSFSAGGSALRVMAPAAMDRAPVTPTSA